MSTIANQRIAFRPASYQSRRKNSQFAKQAALIAVLLMAGYGLGKQIELALATAPGRDIPQAQTQVRFPAQLAARFPDVAAPQAEFQYFPEQFVNSGALDEAAEPIPQF